MRWIFYTLLAINIAVLAYIVMDYLYPSMEISLPVIQSDRDLEKPTASLVLLSELEVEESPVESIAVKKKNVFVSETEISDKKITLKPRCMFLGPFSASLEAENVVSRLTGFDIQAKTTNLLVSTTVGFWLYLPSLPSRKALLRSLSELQRQDIDSYIIPDGDLANGISLGLFSDEARALALKKRIARLGYHPEIVRVPREKRELWVFWEQKDSAGISDEAWSSLLSKKELLQKQQNLCPDVASV